MDSPDSPGKRASRSNEVTAQGTAIPNEAMTAPRRTGRLWPVPGDGHRFRFYQNAKSANLKKSKREIFVFLRGKIGKKTLRKKPRKKFAEDGRLRAYGSGGRKPSTISATCLRIHFPLTAPD
jgi:hypothetical protein